MPTVEVLGNNSNGKGTKEPNPNVGRWSLVKYRDSKKKKKMIKRLSVLAHLEDTGWGLAHSLTPTVRGRRRNLRPELPVQVNSNVTSNY